MMKPTLVALLVTQALIIPQALAADSTDQTIEQLKRQLNEVTEELEYLSDRLDKPESHAATDRILFTGDFRTKAHTLHYQDVVWSPGMTIQTPQGQMMRSMFDQGQGYTPSPKDIDNDVYYTTRLRLNMKAKVFDNVNFAGRLTMFKNWGDSTGVNVFDSWNSFTMDGTSSGHPNGDYLRVERAYFDWKKIGGTEFYLSVGRRPSSYGYPTNLRENELRGGTPSGHLVNFNFDGATLGYHTEHLTGMEGQVVRFCYGQGYESQWGNGELFGNTSVDDVHLGGFNIDILNDGTNFLQMILFGAKDVADGFKGTMSMPDELLGLFQQQGMGNITPVVRYQPSTNIGDIYLGGLTFVRDEDNGIKWFTSLGWTRTDPNGNFGMFGGMNNDPLYQMTSPTEAAPVGVTDSEAHNGYSVYAGVQIPVGSGKFGLEYNYGSKYWTPFTQAQDDPIGSKLATRGHAYEGYYIYDVNPKMFIKLAALYYDFEYTGSGSPVGAPQNIDSVLNGTAFSMLPAMDTAYDVNASITVKF
ncbi:Protein of unknown function [Ferrimonas sediminum]|uniref:DUF3373 domain-containing protein n=1 Tax=Ferrimonas sediminum TaxID=718193 RepID=A0A1G8LFB0_9GAMM|nr:DUF3373 domain-containing protein [Ferrimonas sediminum]SDI54379.1 Protein of unknown function [Ferrimonas sediminum]